MYCRPPPWTTSPDELDLSLRTSSTSHHHSLDGIFRCVQVIPTAQYEAPAPAEGKAGIRDRSGLVVAIAFGLTLAFFWPTLWSFGGTWERYGMSHGWLIAGLVGWLAWRDRADLLKGPGGDPLLLIPLVGLSLLWLLAVIAHVQLVHQVILVALMGCWGLLIFGWRSARTLGVLAATFLLGLPLWDVLVPLLRSLTTLASGSIVRLLGIPAEIEGDWIHIAAGTFIIEDGCAGLNYLLSGVVVGAVYAHVLVRGGWAQLAVLCTAGAFSIIGNWLRVVALIVIGHMTDMQSGLMTSHHGFGWLVFTASLVPFFLVARWIDKRASRTPAGLHADPGPAEMDARADAPPAPLGGIGRVRRAGMASGFAVLGPALFFMIGALPAVDPGQISVADLPGGTEWELTDSSGQRPFDWRPAYQGAEQHEVLRFTNGSAHIYGDRFIYREQRQGAKLIGYPNRIAESSDLLDERVVGPIDQAGTRWVRQAVVRTPQGPVLTWYWYRVGGVDAFSRVHAKALEVPAFLTRRRASELIAFTAACDAEDCRSAFENLAGLMGSRTLR